MSAATPRKESNEAVDSSEDRDTESDDARARGRRERILGAAERLFRHYGPSKTTVADIARACGIGVGSVYLDFSSKESILVALAARRADEIVERMQRAVDGLESPEERVARMLVARVEAFLDMAEDGAHACDLVRCSVSKQEAPGFGPSAREVLRVELSRTRLVVIERRVHALPPPIEIDAALDAIELAFVALGPPYVTRIPRERALLLAEGLARLLLFGV